MKTHTQTHKSVKESETLASSLLSLLRDIDAADSWRPSVSTKRVKYARQMYSRVCIETPVRRCAEAKRRASVRQQMHAIWTKDIEDVIIYDAPNCQRWDWRF